MSKPRLGILADGALAEGRFNGAIAIDQLRPRPGAISGLIALLPRCSLFLYPLDSDAACVDFLRRWVKRQLGECPEIRDDPDQTEAVAIAMLQLGFRDRRPDGLDAWVELPAVGWWEGDPFAWQAVSLAMERAWALDRRAA